MSSNSEIISRTIKDYFGLEKTEVTREQLQHVQKFLKTSNSSALIIEKNDQSINEVSFTTRDLSETNDNGRSYTKPYKSDTLVFVKYIQNEEKTSTNKESIINETQLISRLRNRLHQCDGSSSHVMHALSDLRHAAKYPSVLNALNSERKDLLEKVINWSDNCGEINDSESRDLIEKIGILKAREGKVKAVARVCDQLFNDLDNYQSAKNSLEQVHRELYDESLKLFREWYQNQKGVKLDREKQCIEIDVSTQIPRVTFDPRLVKLAQDARILRCLGFPLPTEIVVLEDEVKKYGMYARELREIVNFYCSVADQILLSQRPMLIDAAKAFTSLLESRDRIAWDGDPSKLTQWIDQLKNFSKNFSTENRLLRRHHQKVLLLIKPLFDVPSKWRSNVKEVTTIMQEIDCRYQNTLPWKRHWDHQLYKILEYHFNYTLIKSDHFASNAASTFMAISGSVSSSTTTEPFKIELCFTAGNVSFKPSIEEIKAKIYLRIKKFLSMVTQFKGFSPLPSPSKNDVTSNGGKHSIFYAIYLRNFNNFPILYEKAEEMIQELEDVRQKFIDWAALHYLIKGHNQLDLAQFLGCDTLDDYKHNLTLIKGKSQKFNKDFMENEIKCESGNFIINIVPIKTFIDWLLIEIDKLLAKSLKEKCIDEMRNIDEQCSDLLHKLEKRPQNIGELKIIDHLLRNELNSVTTLLSDRFSHLFSKVSFLMKWSAKIAPDISDLTTKYDEFITISETRDSLLESYRDILKAKTTAEIGNISEEIKTFTKRWEKMPQNMKESKEIISEMRIECDILATKCDELIQSCDYFVIEKPEYFNEFSAIVADVRETDAKWNLIQQFESGISHYMDMEWIVSRNKLNAIENYISKWEEENPNVGSMFDNKIKEWRELLSILKLCRGECYAKNHWCEFLSLISINSIVNDYESLKLSHLISARKELITAKDAIKELNTRAANEMSIRETFNELDMFAANTVLTLYSHITSTKEEIKLIKDWRLVLNQVGESILTLQSVKNAEFFSDDFAERSALWETRLSSLDSILGLLNSVQRKWIFLEPIYAKDDTEMFSEYSFSPVSKDYIDILKIIESDPHVMRLLHITSLVTRLKTIDQTLITCQKKLQTFLEQSRARFPRFYFLADDDLLLILAGKAQVSQSGLLKKLFNNAIVKLNFDGKFIESVESPEGECIHLKQRVLVDTDRGAAGVEVWLRSLENELKSSLRSLFFDSFVDNERNFKNNWDLPSQVISMVQWVMFTKKVEESIQRNSLSDLKSEYGKQLSSLTSQESNDDIVLNIKVKSLIMDTIHFVSVVEELIKLNTHDVNDWIWQKQLRFYAKTHDNKLEIKMGNSTSEHSFEYLGCFGGAKLVHTPLTDKCFLTLTQAMDMGLGGNPYGPAGTGKTESVKALGQHFGRQVLVFNCDEAIDVKAMTRILVGLIKCGAWGCFDEFNRLQLDVLSSLSSQIQAIQTALKSHKNTVNLSEYGDVNINQNAAIFITLNPAGKQYGGRNRLPDNLKSLFLPVAMTVPDNEIISRVMLLAEGFSLNMSNELGEKITIWFELARDCMTHQKHYDWGLRAIKTCLESSGRRLKSDPNKDEIKVVIETLREQIKSKLIDEDDRQFEALVCDVFGERAMEESDSNDTARNELKKAIIQIIEENNMIIDDTQIRKIQEFNEQLQSRLGVVILGKSGSGKSTLWKVLKDAKRVCENTIINAIIINPKAVTRSQLIGYVDEDTREWHDGIITFKSREVSRDESNGQFWLIFDGDIDPDWVEALNSVLDDNKVLTLPSGERIDFDAKKCNLIFETTSLRFASPATISRLGVTCISGIKSNQLISAAMKEINARISNEEILRIVQESDEEIRVSFAKTVLSHITYAISHDGDAVRGLLRVQFKLNGKSHTQKRGSLIITPTVYKSVEFLQPWIESEDHVLFIGTKGVGKNAIAEYTLLKTGTVARVNCTPDTTPYHVISAIKAQSALITSGSSKVMKSHANNKLILYIKHLELITADKWQSKALLAFLTQLMSYNGFYDYTTFEWIQIHKFQIIATCNTIKALDPRFISLMNVVHVSLPPLEEIDEILNGRIPEHNNWKAAFTSAFGKVIREISRYQSHDMQVLRIGVEIVESLNRYANDVNADVLRYEFFRSFHSHIESQTALYGALTLSLGGDHNRDNVIFASLSGSSKLTNLSIEQFTVQIKKLITSWVNETEIRNPKVALIPEMMSLFTEVNSFLSESDNHNNNNNNNKIKGLVLVGRSGCGRKLALTSTAHTFGYDQIWSPKVAINEKHLSNELKALLYGEEEQSDKKILLIVDEMHLQLMPHLRDHIYSIINDYHGTAFVRIALTLNSMSDVRQLMWGRVCHVHLVQQWSGESLENIPKMMIKDQNSPKFAKIFSQIHHLFPQHAEDPRRYIAFVDTFAEIMNKKKSDVEKRREHLKLGVAKLDEASQEVEKLKTEAQQQKQLLALKRQEADDALHLITSSMHGAEDQKVELEEIKLRTEKETAKLKVRKREIDAELKEIEPMLIAAKAAVGGIKSESLSEIRSLRAPPEVIRDILEGVLRLMGVNDTSWVSMKSFLSRRGVKDEIMNFDSRKITPDMREKVEVLLQNRSDSYDPVLAKRASVAAAPLAEWVKANASFSKVLHKIKPLEDEQNRLESGLRSAQSRMRSLSNQLEGVEVEVGTLRDRLNQVTVEAAQIEVGLKQTSQILAQSEKLISDLSGEFSRWKDQLEEINAIINTLPINSLVAAAYIVYCSSMASNEKRKEMLEKCCQIANVSDKFDAVTFLDCSTEEEVFLAINTNHLTPLICDPSRKIVSKFANCEITDMRNREWIKVLELSLRFGRTLIINDFNKLDILLLPVVSHQIYGAPDSGRNWCYIGEKRVDYNSNFKLYFLTQDANSESLSNPLFNVINLSPSGSGMTTELLSLIIQSRRPELETKKTQLETTKQTLEASLRDLESQLLKKLTSSTGNLLNDADLVKSLKDIKTSAINVEQSLIESAKLSEDLNRERAEYESLATFASRIYFLIQELVTLNPMYRFGVSEYESVFSESLETHKDLTPGLMLQVMYNYVSRGLFPEDRVIFKRFLQKQCPQESNTLAIDDGISLKEFIISVYGSKRKVTLIMTSQGSDPTSELQEIAQEMGIKRFTILSMGADVIARAQQVITGDDFEWVCLTNLHLVLSSLPNFARILTNNTGKMIVLVTECSKTILDFPVSLLELSNKFAYESSPGLQPQLKRLATDSNVKTVPELRILSYLHAVCCERRHYVPQGWTKNYEFGFNDFRSASTVIQTVIQSKDRRLRFDFIRGLLMSVIYGGKLDNQVDESILNALVKRWFTTNQDDQRGNLQDEISVLGLPSNVNKLRQSIVEERLMKGLKILEKATNVSQIKEEIKRLRILWKELTPNAFTNKIPHSAVALSNNVNEQSSSPLTVYVNSEFQQIQKLIQIIDKDLNSDDSSEAYNSLLSNEAPDQWIILWPSGPQQGDQFIGSVVAMAREIRKLLESPSPTNTTFDLSHFLYPTSLLNALKQQASRELRVSVDWLKMYCSWGKTTLKTARSMRVTITGIVIEGALFEQNQLKDCHSESPLQSPMPPLSLYFLPKDSPSPYDTDVIALPVYGSSGRESVLTWFDVNCTSGSQSHWTQCATSLVIKYLD